MNYKNSATEKGINNLDCITIQKQVGREFHFWSIAAMLHLWGFFCLPPSQLLSIYFNSFYLSFRILSLLYSTELLLQLVFPFYLYFVGSVLKSPSLVGDDYSGYKNSSKSFSLLSFPYFIITYLSLLYYFSFSEGLIMLFLAVREEVF